MKSWKTTALGILAGIGGIITQITALLDGKEEPVFSWDLLLASLAVLGLGAISRDNNVTSEDAGAKK